MNNLLNENQQKAVDHIEGPLLVLAGAGSGKTFVVTKKIEKLIKIGINPDQILAVTFTNKAANEMLHRIKKRTNSQILCTTFHSLGAKILRESIHHFGYLNNFLIYDEEDSIKLLKECIKAIDPNIKKEKIKKIKHKISTFKNDLLEIENTEVHSNFSEKELQILKLYQSKLKSFNALDFDDLLYLSTLLLKNNKEILSHYQNRWFYILIDEYQDTNFSQYMLAKLLSLKNQNICAVGDPDQSIYSFRGAKYQNILNFENDFENAKIIKLEKNYRSTQTILQASNHLIKNNSNRYEKNLFSENLENSEKVKIFTAFSEKTESKFIIEKILEYKKTISLNDIAIFYRTNFQSRIFEDNLLSKNIPYKIYGGMSFYQRKEIKDILSFLNLIISDNDYISFTRTLAISTKGFGKATIEKLIALSEKENIPILKLLFQIIQNEKNYPIKFNQTQKENLKKYLDNIIYLRTSYKKTTIDETILNVISCIDYLNYLKQDPESFQTRKENIDEFISKAYEFSEQNDRNLEKFLLELSLNTSKADKDSKESVKLMTLHNSKGLEFSLVFISGLEEDLLPHVNSKNYDEELQEERRLFYVGMTRAKRYLYITNSLTRFIWGDTKMSLPSRFLKEIPNEYIEKINDDYSSNFRYESNFNSSNDINISVPIKKVSLEKYYPGLKVYHKIFGRGNIQKVYTSSVGETVDVYFQNDNQTRSLVTKYAKLEVLS